MRMNVSKGNELVLDSKHDCPPTGERVHRCKEGLGRTSRGRLRGRGQVREGCLSSEHLGSWGRGWRMAHGAPSKSPSLAGRGLMMRRDEPWQALRRIFRPNCSSVVIQGRAPYALRAGICSTNPLIYGPYMIDVKLRSWWVPICACQCLCRLPGCFSPSRI